MPIPAQCGEMIGSAVIAHAKKDETDAREKTDQFKLLGAFLSTEKEKRNRKSIWLTQIQVMQIEIRGTNPHLRLPQFCIPLNSKSSRE